MWPLLPRPRRTLQIGGESYESGAVAADEEDGPADPVLLEFSKDGTPVDQQAAFRRVRFATEYITTHKNPVVCTRFSPCGRWIATGSEDTSIKLLDVAKMHSQHRAASSSVIVHEETRPTRSFYDHTAPVCGLAFHPTQSVLASCSRDCSVKLFDFGRQNARRAFRSLTDSNPCRAITIHPGGDHILVATDHPEPRLIDFKTLQMYIMASSLHRPYAPINDVAYSPEGRVFATASLDGSVRIIDTLTNALVREFKSGVEITSVCFSRNGQCVMFAARDFKTRLYDWSSGKLLRLYKGCSVRSVFTAGEAGVASIDENGLTVLFHNARTGELVQRVATGHASPMRSLDTCPVEDAFMTCSEDHRARFWAAS